jgi:hypothetical protein
VFIAGRLREYHGVQPRWQSSSRLCPREFANSALLGSALRIDPSGAD